MPKFKDLSGKKIGNLTFIKPVGKKNGNYIWKVKCDCGKLANLPGYTVKSGNTKSCGCLKGERLEEISQTPEYFCYRDLLKRCTNPEDKNFKNYGGRGIRVCRRWRQSFQNFLDDMGQKPSPNHSIERKDNGGNYEPDNCIWATAKIQSNNTRANRLIRAFGMNQKIQTWAKLTGLSANLIAQRIDKLKWSSETALKTPKRKQKNGA